VPDNWQHAVQLLQCQNLHVSGALLTQTQATALIEYGLGVYAFTVNSVEEAIYLFEMGVHGVFSDHPGKLLEHFS